jgi:cysteine desulfurase
MRIYLDHNATTPVRPEVVEAMTRSLRDGWGNPSSVHAEGAAARSAVERAREQVAALVGAEPSEVVFTGSASEANNTALHGGLALRRGRVVTSCVEHPSVEEPLRALEERGLEVLRLPVDGGGRVDAAEAAAALGEGAALLAVIWAQNETGVLQPVEDLVDAARARGVWTHLDATQAVGKIPVDLRRVPAQLLSASAHKFGGPKGAGFLVERGGAALPAWIRGGPQERRRRGGTENVAGIVGLGVACALAERELEARRREWARLRDRLWEGLRAKVPRVRRNGDAAHALPNTLNVEFEGADGEALLQALDLEGIAVSAGAACHSGSLSPSPVLLAMGLEPARAAASLRFSVGHGTCDADVERVLLVLPDLVARVREAASS